MNIQQTVFSGIKDIKKEQRKPSYIIADYSTYMEMKEDEDKFCPSFEMKKEDGDRYMGIPIAIVLNIAKDIEILKVV